MFWRTANRLLGLGRLLGQEDGLDVRQYTTLGDGYTGEKLVQFLVVADGELEMTGDDSCLLVVAGSIASQLENFSGQVFHDGGQVDWSSGTGTLGVVTLAEETVDSSYWKL